MFLPSSLSLSHCLLVITLELCLPAGSTYWFSTSGSWRSNQKNGGFKRKSPQEDEGMYEPKRCLMKLYVGGEGVQPGRATLMLLSMVGAANLYLHLPTSASLWPRTS